MESGRASRSAQAVAAARAFGALLYGRRAIVTDQYAVHFLAPELQKRYNTLRRLAMGPLKRLVLAGYERRHPGAMGWLLARHRYIDDAIRGAVASGAGQLVLVGAGYDTRALRLGLPAGFTVVEVDHPATQLRKRQVVEDFYGSVAGRVCYVPLDLARESLSALRGGPYHRAVRAIFVMEGLLWYLEPGAVQRILRAVRELAPPGTSVVFDYLVADAAARGEARSQQRLSEQWGEPMCWAIGPAELPEFLSELGLQLLEDVDADELVRRYRRIPMHGYFRIAHAVLAPARL